MTTPDRLAQMLTVLKKRGGDATSFANLCEATAEVSGTDGASILLMAQDSPRGLLYATDDVGRRIEELHFVMGEGPCLDAFRHGTPVGEQDLAHPAAPRWGAFTPAALDLGVGAIFALPLIMAPSRLGALCLYRSRPGPLSDEQFANALVMAGVAARTLVTAQADAPAGALSVLIEAHSNLRLTVHQASGMVSVQMHIGVADALALLRGYAVRHGMSIDTVASDVIDRRLRFDDSYGTRVG